MIFPKYLLPGNKFRFRMFAKKRLETINNNNKIKQKEALVFVNIFHWSHFCNYYYYKSFLK